jgi:hypothetical protein
LHYNPDGGGWWGPPDRLHGGAFPLRADTSDVAFRLLLALGDLWEGLQRTKIDPTVKGLHMSTEDLGGYRRYSAGCGSHARLVVEWNETLRHLRVIRCQEWPNFEVTVSSTIGYVRKEARERGLADMVDKAFMKACEEPTVPVKRTVLSMATTSAAAPLAARRA